MVGKTVSHYRIIEKLGGGGMGVVYKAEDTRLKRTIALKVLPPDRVADPNRKRRFIQEAQAASALNHPNIITIHDIDEAEGVHFIAMEYVQGKTLDRLIARHGLRVNEALKYAVQMAAALAKAHSAGIVHRDLKPTNVMATDDGLVKVLDFGLAKLTEAVPTGEAETAATAGPVTEEGTIVGTVGYMSPEQAEGKPVDARSDIFSFGSVLYEMLTGQRAFQGETKASTIAAILREEPKPLSQVAEGLPREVDRLVKRCLRKDREHRFQTMADLKVALEELKEESDSGELAEAPAAGAVLVPAPAGRPRGALLRRWVLLLACAAAVLAIAAGLYLLRGHPATDSVAVLPFASTGSDRNTEYLSDGLAEQLINSLSQLPQLRVIARTTAFTYKGKSIDLAKMGKDLRVRTALTGKVVQRGDSLTVQVDLVGTEDGAELWGQQFIRKASELHAVEEEIARRVSDKLRVRLSGEEQERLAKRYTENPEAYNLYVQGRHYLDESEVVKSRVYFEQAIAKDPNYALAHAGLADSYSYAWIWGIEPASSVMPKAREEALKAIQADSSAGEGHTSLGIIKLLYDWDWAGAEQELHRAAELSPNSPYVRHWYAHYLETIGRISEAIAIMLQVLDADPLSPMILGDLYNEYISTHQWDQVLTISRRLAALSNSPTPSFWDPLAYERLGRHEEALATLEKLRAAPGLRANIEDLGVLLAQMGKRAEAEKILADLKGAVKKERIPHYIGMARLCSALGDRDQAFAYLDQAYDARDQGAFRHDLAFLNRYDSLEGVRHDPRFVALLKKIGLPAEAIH
jgi:serine/threonine-protein kinase